MNRLSVFLMVAGGLSTPAFADIYGKAAPEEPEQPLRIKTVSRPSPVAPVTISAASPEAPTSSRTPEMANPAPVVPQAQAAAISPVKASWQIKPEDRLISNTLIRWAKDAGWLVFWEAPTDFEAVPARFSGSFKDVVTQLVMAYSTSDAPITAHFADDGVNRSVLIEKYKGNSSNARGVRND